MIWLLKTLVKVLKFCRKKEIKKGKWGAVKVTSEKHPYHLLEVKYDSIQLTDNSWNRDFIVKNKGERFYVFRTDSKNEIPGRFLDLQRNSSPNSFILKGVPS